MAEKVLSWEEKLQQGIPLNELERVKYDATRITLRRIREEVEEKAAEEAKKQAFNPTERDVIDFAQTRSTEPVVDVNTESVSSKKGK